MIIRAISRARKIKPHSFLVFSSDLSITLVYVQRISAYIYICHLSYYFITFYYIIILSQIGKKSVSIRVSQIFCVSADLCKFAYYVNT